MSAVSVPLKKILLSLSLISVISIAACGPAAAEAVVLDAGLANPAVNPADTAEVTAVAEKVLIVEEELLPDVEAAFANPAALSDEEAAGLVFMREEEKLARDVYLVLYDLWGMRIFQNIAASEQNHTDTVASLLETCGLADPVINDETGAFVNQDLQALFDELVMRGGVSLEEALRVGAAIEEIDILDLEDFLAQTENPDLRLVYDNLLNGSHNHLRAFTSTLEMRTGEFYEPQYLAEEAYQAIAGGAVQGGASDDGRRKGRMGG